MTSGLLNYEMLIRVGCFLAVFAVMAAAEMLWPRRHLVLGRLRRWPTNLGIVALGSVLVRLLGMATGVLALPLVAVAAAVLAESQGWGLLNLFVLPGWFAIATAVVVLDFSIWLQHLLAHRIPLLWRLHKMHHADRDIDVTTALRFHPIEIGLSMLYKVTWVLALGAPVEAVIAFEVILNALAIFNHANISLPPAMEGYLRSVVVTPDMHRVHHSVRPNEHHANFGFNLSIWDRAFATYVPEPLDGHTAMTIGLPEYQSEGPARIGWSLALPFRRKS